MSPEASGGPDLSSVPRDVWAVPGAVFGCHSHRELPAWSGWGPQRVSGQRVDSEKVGRPGPGTGGVLSYMVVVPENAQGLWGAAASLSI